MIGMIRCYKGFQDRKSTRLNSSHVESSYAVFCLKKKNANHTLDGRDGVSGRTTARCCANATRGWADVAATHGFRAILRNGGVEMRQGVLPEPLQLHGTRVTADAARPPRGCTDRVVAGV